MLFCKHGYKLRVCTGLPSKVSVTAVSPALLLPTFGEKREEKCILFTCRDVAVLRLRLRQSRVGLLGIFARRGRGDDKPNPNWHADLNGLPVLQFT
nr:hypothetical protein Iba_chr01aCG21110 [Ipomoea batatas]GMC70704.1 hypothetical protein Iba_chr03aCG18350 [Ipomoea batatas]GMC76981.1 hypothetical protein Iba_chr03eCG6320 [Ipomoea batatas]